MGFDGGHPVRWAECPLRVRNRGYGLPSRPQGPDVVKLLTQTSVKAAAHKVSESLHR